MAIFAVGLSVPEGPVCLQDGTWVVVEMGADRGSVTQVGLDGRILRIVARTGRPNGLAVDRNGVIWVAESQKPSLVKLTLGGLAEVVATGTTEKPFLFPNDLCFGSDGKLYMTDSGVLADEFAPGGKVRPDYDKLPIDGRVYVYDPANGALEEMDSGLRFPNGIAFGPDGGLYVNETLTGNVYVYPRSSDATFGPRRYYGNVLSKRAQASGLKGPDGMAFGETGELYVAVFGQQDVTVLGPGGRVVRRIVTEGRLPTNVAFGLDQAKIYVTEDELGQIEVFDVDCKGLALSG